MVQRRDTLIKKGKYYLFMKYLSKKLRYTYRQRVVWQWSKKQEVTCPVSFFEYSEGFTLSTSGSPIGGSVLSCTTSPVGKTELELWPSVFLLIESYTFVFNRNWSQNQPNPNENPFHHCTSFNCIMYTRVFLGPTL